MEVAAGHANKWDVLLVEFLASSVLVYAVLASGGNAGAVAGTLFCLILACGPISGAHFNPAVTVAVYVWNRKFKKDLGFMIMLILTEFAGALLGIFWAWLVLMPEGIYGEEVSIPKQWVAALCPVGVTENGSIETPCDTSL